HRSTSAAEIYFVQNRRREWATVEARFRVTNCAPQLWHPQSGRIERPAVFVREAAGIRMPLRLAPWGSVFVVFPAAEERPHLTRADDTLALRSLDNGLVEAGASQAGAYEVETADGLSATIEFTDIPASIPLDGPWQLHFPEGSDAPAAVELRALVSWTALEDPAIRSFSGIARYELVFDLPPGALADGVRWQLDLGDLWAVARVRLNGRDLGVLWQPPYEADATDSLRPRGNCLEIQIANTWANRLVGDAALPAAERRTRTNITRSLGKTWADIPLRESGLFGPVRLVPLRVKQLSLP
ncbi:MAG: hypothetical protein H7A47_18090, partial [Verrucomicrobiales bacterium]|nr:hypothetical protein [Verrucomicrobiales bacterium]